MVIVKVHAVDLTIFIDQIETLQLLCLSKLNQTLELVDPTLQISVGKILCVPLWYLMELKQMAKLH